MSHAKKSQHLVETAASWLLFCATYSQSFCAAAVSSFASLRVVVFVVIVVVVVGTGRGRRQHRSSLLFIFCSHVQL